MSPSGDPRHEGPHRYSGIAVTRAARSLLRALDGLAHAEHTIVMTNLMGVRWKLSSHQRSPGCILVLCNTWTDQSTNTGGCRFKLPGAVSTRFKTRCLNFLRIFPANVIQTHTTFYSLVCCYWDAVSFARFWEAIEVILLRKSQIAPENFNVDIWKQRSHLKANIWRQILYLKDTASPPKEEVVFLF